MNSYRIALIALAVLPSFARAQSRTALVVGAGPSFPVGSLRDTQTRGTDLLLGLVRGSDDTPIGLRFDFSYDKLPGKTVKGVKQPERRTVGGTADLVISFPGYNFKPYLLGGAGAFKMKTIPQVGQSKTRFGFDFGLGLTIPIGSKAVFVESRLNSVTRPKAKPFRYVPVLFGILF